MAVGVKIIPLAGGSTEDVDYYAESRAGGGGGGGSNGDRSSGTVGAFYWLGGSKGALMVALFALLALLNWVRKTKGLTIKRRLNYVFNKVGF